jgi:hypothetical protein
VKNYFGGGRKNSLYVPLSEVEQEAISRLIASDDLRVVVHGWGFVDSPVIQHGDARVQVRFKLVFNAPALPMKVHYFDLELQTKSGLRLYAARQSTTYQGNPIEVAAGVELDLVWDIMVKALDPSLVKSLVPGATGLTSRRQDKDTREITSVGNMKLDEVGMKLLKLADGVFKKS